MTELDALVSQGVDVLVMTCSSTYVMAVSHYLNLRRIPALITMSTSPSLSVQASRQWSGHLPASARGEQRITD